MAVAALGVAGSEVGGVAKAAVPRRSEAARSKGLGDYLRKFKAAVRRKDCNNAVALQEAYLQHGGQPRHWMFNSLVSMFAKRSQLPQALDMASGMRDAGLKWDAYTYGAVLDALSKAEMPPYLLDRKYATEAKRYFDEMREAGVEPNHVTFHSLMDCYAKAGLPDCAFAVLEDMRRSGLQPGLVTFNILINACGKAKQPLRAQHVLETLMPQAGVQADVVSWNGLLGAYAQAGQIDNAYYAWEKMKKLGVLPTKVTAAHLSEVFVGSPVLLDELLEEARARELKARARSGDASAQDVPLKAELEAVTEEAAHAATRSGAAGQPAGSSREPFDMPQDLLYLDLHRLSKPSAQAELLRRLHLLTKMPAPLQEQLEGEKRDIESLKGPSQQLVSKGLLIITGHGRHSKTRGSGVLRTSVREVLRRNNISFEEPANAGRIVVPLSEIEGLRLRRAVIQEQAKLYRGASMRLMLMGCALFGLLSTTYLMKHIGPLTAS